MPGLCLRGRESGSPAPAVTPARRQPAPGSSHGAGPGGDQPAETPGLAGRHRLREGCVRRTDTDNTAGAPPPPALKGAAPSPGGAEPAGRPELEEGGGLKLYT